MSRSRKKNPVIKDGFRGARKRANKATRAYWKNQLRHHLQFGDPDYFTFEGQGAIYCKWNICDWRFQYFNEAPDNKWRILSLRK